MKCHCACRDLCGHKHCPIRPFVRLFSLLRNPQRNSASWWQLTREARDGVLAVLRHGPIDATVTPEDAKFWAQYLSAMLRLSARLDREYLLYVASHDYGGLRGTA